MRIQLTLFIMALGCTPGAQIKEPEPNREVSIRHLGIADSLRLVKAGYYVIHDEASWQTYLRSRWSPVTGTSLSVPDVDFKARMVLALEGRSAQIGFEKPVIREAHVVQDTLHLQLGDMEGPLTMAGDWVEIIELPRSDYAVVLHPSNEYDAQKSWMLREQRLP